MVWYYRSRLGCGVGVGVYVVGLVIVIDEY